VSAPPSPHTSGQNIEILTGALLADEKTAAFCNIDKEEKY